VLAQLLQHFPGIVDQLFPSVWMLLIQMLDKSRYFFFHFIRIQEATLFFGYLLIPLQDGSQRRYFINSLRMFFSQCQSRVATHAVSKNIRFWNVMLIQIIHYLID